MFVCFTTLLSPFLVVYIRHTGALSQSSFTSFRSMSGELLRREETVTTPSISSSCPISRTCFSEETSCLSVMAWSTL